MAKEDDMMQKRPMRMIIQGILVLILFLVLVALEGFLNIPMGPELNALVAALLENLIKPKLGL